MKSIHVLCAMCLGIAASGGAAKAHEDVSPYEAVTGGGTMIVIGGFDDDTATFTPVMSVFGYDFLEDADDPFITEFPGDPGFNAQAGALTPGASVGIEVRSDLYYWDGASTFVENNPVPNSESLALVFLGGSRVAGTGTGTLTPMFFGPTVLGDGSLHVHLTSWLRGSDGNSIPARPGSWGAGDGIEPTPGIYFFQFGVVTDTPGVAASDTAWLVYNVGLDEELHDAAIDFLLGPAQDNGVPEPAVLSVLSAVVLSAMRRRSFTAK